MINEKVGELLDKGEEVYSELLGRLGKVVCYNEHSLFPIRIKLKHSNFSEGVTTFDSGDSCRLIKRDDVYVVVHYDLHSLKSNEEVINL